MPSIIVPDHAHRVVAGVEEPGDRAGDQPNSIQPITLIMRNLVMETAELVGSPLDRRSDSSFEMQSHAQEMPKSRAYVGCRGRRLRAGRFLL